MSTWEDVDLCVPYVAGSAKNVLVLNIYKFSITKKGPYIVKSFRLVLF
jgi:hypothetical protein